MKDGTTGLFLLPIDRAESCGEEYFRRWFPARLEQSRRFRVREDALRSLAAAMLLREVLGLEEADMETAPGGKPRARNGEWEFNLSHSGDYAALAVSRRSVGADIEKCELRHIAVARSVFQPEELAWMDACPAERFTALWTMKEAVAKALGLGLRLKLRELNVLPLLSGEGVRAGGHTVYGSSLSVPGYSLAVCTLEAPENVEIEYL